MDSSNEDELLSLDSDSGVDNFTSSKNRQKVSKKYTKRKSSNEKSMKESGKITSSPSDAASCYRTTDGINESNVVATAGTSMKSFLQQTISDDNDTNSSGNEDCPHDRSGNLDDRELEITLSDEEEDTANETPSNNTTDPQPSTSTSETTGESTSATNGYGLRRKRKINYGEIENGPDVEDKFAGSKTKQRKEVLDIFSLSPTKIAKYIQNLDLVDNFTKIKIVFMHGTDSSRLHSVTKFFEACGQQFESMFVQIRYEEENYKFLQNVLKTCSSLRRLDYRYQNQSDALHLLELLKKLTEANSLPSLMSLKLVGVSGTENLCEAHVSLISQICSRLQSLEVGDALWEDVKATTIEKLLENAKSSLETLVINGGFKGGGDNEKILISLPRMESLKTLCICPKYTFLSEIKNPYSKKARVITLEGQDNSKQEPFKIAIKFTCDLQQLQRLVLGNLIDMEDLLFSSVRRLQEFRCGSYWNLSIRFPSDGSRKTLLESSVTEFQFPDALKDPLFTVKVAKHFPNVKKVWLYLPSVPVLRAFFKAFDNSKVEELYLKTQFDFEKTMESCLLPNMRDVLQKSQETETLVQTLREYKHFDEYIRYYNVELPVEAEDLMEGHSAGIGALKSLKVLHLEHIPRTLLIPFPEDERKWYDHHCKFMSTTFGYERYPLNFKCHKEILKLDLSEYIWKNIEISCSYTEDFHQAGFVDIPDVQVIREINTISGYSYDDEEDEDIFTPIHKSTPKGAQVKITPSMLLPCFKAKSENADV